MIYESKRIVGSRIQYSTAARDRTEPITVVREFTNLSDVLVRVQLIARRGQCAIGTVTAVVEARISLISAVSDASHFNRTKYIFVQLFK